MNFVLLIKIVFMIWIVYEVYCCFWLSNFLMKKLKQWENFRDTENIDLAEYCPYCLNILEEDISYFDECEHKFCFKHESCPFYKILECEICKRIKNHSNLFLIFLQINLNFTIEQCKFRSSPIMYLFIIFYIRKKFIRIWNLNSKKIV